MSVFGPVIRTRQPQAPFLASAIDSHGRGPTLDLHFFNGAPLDSRISFARASSATYYDINGVRQNLGNNVPRLGFDPIIIGKPDGWLLEAVITNRLANSTAPVTQTSTTSLPAATYCLWLEGSGSVVSSAGTAVGSGFGTATAAAPNVFTITTAGTVVFTVSGSVTAFQCENNPSPTSLIITAGTFATRAVENPTMPVGSWHNFNAGTLLVEAIQPNQVTNTAGYLGDITDATNNNRTAIFRNNAANTVQAFHETGGVAKFNVVIGTMVPGSIFKAAMSYGSSGHLTSLNGVAGPGSAAAFVPLAAATILALGFNGAATNLNANGYLRRVRYWPRALSQGELNQVTL